MEYAQQRPARGFTLTELAIVLGVIGLVIGLIWSAAGSVYANMRLDKAQQEVIAIEHNVRALYASRNTLATTTNFTELTVALAQAGVVPSEMLVVNPLSMGNQVWTTYPRSPWGSVVLLQSYGAITPGDSIAIYLDKDDQLPPSVCGPLIARFTGPGADSSLIAVYIGNHTWGGPGSSIPDPGIKTYTISSFPNCTSAGFMFKIKG